MLVEEDLVDYYEDRRACSSAKCADDICRVPRVALTTHGQSNHEKSDISGKEERAKPADLLAKGRAKMYPRTKRGIAR